MLNVISKENAILTPEEIDDIRKGAKIWIKIKDILVKYVKPGATGLELNDRAKECFDEFGVETAFFNYHDFPGHICISVNDCIVHGVGNSIAFKPEDKVTLDIGFKFNDVYIDSACTLIVDPDSNRDYYTFVERCKKVLWAGIKAANEELKNGRELFNGDIAFAIESYVKSFNDKNISLIDGFVGHSIGRNIHQKPHIFNKGFKRKQGDKISVRSVICIEPMLMKQSTGEYRKGKNGFDIFSKEPGVFTCHWEHMVLVKSDGVEVLTASEEEVKEYLG